MGRAKHSIGHQIKRPSSKTRRATFAILRIRYDVETGKRLEIKTLKLAEVDAINQGLKAGVHDFAKADELMVEILDRLNAEAWKLDGKVVHNKDNHKLLDAFFEADYAYRPIEEESRQGFRWACERAIDAVGELSLYSADLLAIQAAVNRKYKDAPMKQREAVDRLNTLLKFAGRVKGKHDRLKRATKPRPKVKYLSEAELVAVLPHLPSDELRIVARCSFYTGARVGELFASEPGSVQGHTLNIVEQLKRKKPEKELKKNPAAREEPRERKPPKRGSVRPAYVTKEGLEALGEFFELGEDRRIELRDEPLAKILRAACEAAFPRRRDKWLCWHDLRHSYAIMLVSKGVPLTLVAQSLGNSLQVCQDYYAGRVLVPETVAAIARYLGEG